MYTKGYGIANVGKHECAAHVSRQTIIGAVETQTRDMLTVIIS